MTKKFNFSWIVISLVNRTLHILFSCLRNYPIYSCYRDSFCKETWIRINRRINVVVRLPPFGRKTTNCKDYEVIHSISVIYVSSDCLNILLHGFRVLIIINFGSFNDDNNRYDEVRKGYFLPEQLSREKYSMKFVRPPL